jgi:HK97 family phage prohead protease
MLALCGYGWRWDEIIHNHYGKNLMIAPTAFDRSLSSGAIIRFLLNHQDHWCAGSTNDNLSVCSDNYGLALRFRITDTPDGRRIRKFAENGRDAISIAFNYHGAKTESRCINGVDVTCIVDTDLWEISFLTGNTGAAKSAYAVLKDTNPYRSLREECSDGKFLYDAKAIAFKRELGKYPYN